MWRDDALFWRKCLWDTLICYRLPDERSNDNKRITLLTVIYWMLQLGCLQYWNGTFISTSLSTFSLHYNLLCRQMPFSDVWDHMFLILGECRQSSVMQMIATLIVQPWHIQCVLFSLTHQVCETARNIPCLQLFWKYQLLIWNKLATWKVPSGRLIFMLLMSKLFSWMFYCYFHRLPCSQIQHYGEMHSRRYQ